MQSAMSVFVLVWLKSELSSWCSCRSIVTMLRRCIVDPQHCGDLGVIIPHSVLLIHPYSLTVSRQTKIIKAAATNSLTHSLSYFLSRSSTYCTRNNSASLQVALLTSTLTEDDISLCHFEQITHSFCRFVVLSFCRFVVLSFCRFVTSSLFRRFSLLPFDRSIVRSFVRSVVAYDRRIEVSFAFATANQHHEVASNQRKELHPKHKAQTNKRTNERTNRAQTNCAPLHCCGGRFLPQAAHPRAYCRGWLVGWSVCCMAVWRRYLWQCSEVK